MDDDDLFAVAYLASEEEDNPSPLISDSCFSGCGLLLLIGTGLLIVILALFYAIFLLV